MTFEVRPFDAPLGAEVVGIDLSKPLDDDSFRRVHRAWLEHLVLVFRDQDMTPEQHIAFSRRLGDLKIHVMRQFLLPGHPEVYVLSNVMEKGQPVGKGSTPYWHSDLSYDAEPAKASMLYGREVPEVGGDTLYANMYAAYEALPAAMKARLEGLEAVHDFASFGVRYRRRYGSDENLPKALPGVLESMRPVVHPVVLEHPETGRRALYVNEGFTSRILGLPEDESEALLETLFAHSKDDRFVYRHKWRLHDAVLWDNRCTNHSATGGYQAPMRRLMHRTTIAGEPPRMAGAGRALRGVAG